MYILTSTFNRGCCNDTVRLTSKAPPPPQKKNQNKEKQGCCLLGDKQTRSPHIKICFFSAFYNYYFWNLRVFIIIINQIPGGVWGAAAPLAPRGSRGVGLLNLMKHLHEISWGNSVIFDYLPACWPSGDTEVFSTGVNFREIMNIHKLLASDGKLEHLVKFRHG